jgi:hypothetical protein
MSHITNIELEIKDLVALKAACNRMGFTFMENQTTCNFYRDQKADCLHAIQVPGAAYEVGVVENKNGDYHLIWDPYIHVGLESSLGPGGGKLKQAYGIEKAKLEARKKGYSVYERVKADGAITLSVEGGF